jgi:DNA-binding transcriptional LysR family regulator
METRLLEYFVAVAQEGSFTRAAVRCQAAQSTVSAGIRALESDLGVALFERDTRTVGLTPAGADALPIATGLLDQLGRLRDVGAQTGVLRGRLRVGTLTNVVPGWDLAKVLGRFHADYPRVDLQLTSSPMGSAGLSRQLIEGRIDLAFLGGGANYPDELEAERIGQSTFVALLPSDHPLSTKSSIALADLANEAFVDSPSGFANRVALDAALAAKGIERRTTIEVADIEQTAQFVAAGLGVAALPGFIATGDHPGVTVRRLDERIEWQLYVATRARPHAAPKALRDLILREFPSLLPDDRRPAGAATEG